MARTLDPGVDEAIAAAALRLLGELGFARMTMDGVARAAGVGKPALYRRFAGKAELVAVVIASRLPVLEVSPATPGGRPDGAPETRSDTREELWTAMQRGLPTDGPAYVGLIGGLIAEHNRHPELIEAFRTRVLLPRRAIVIGLISRGQDRGDIRADVDPETALDLLAGSFLARVFAGLDTGPDWRQAAFENWWELHRESENR